MRSHTFQWRLRPSSPVTSLLILFLLLLTGVWFALGTLDAPPALAAPKQQTIPLQAISFATGLSQPIKVTNAGDDRLFVVQQTGEIRIVQPNGTVLATSFLDISDRVLADGERGLLGLVFEPGSTTVFYVNYTRQSTDSQQLGDTVIARYRVTGGDPNVADPNSEEIVLIVDQPYPNHNAGDLAFGPDGYLYIPLGDGGSGGDPENRAQNLNELLGKLLRIDVTGVSTYTIPSDNPYVNDNNPLTLGEIWAWGFRNPWRFSFDRQTDDLYIGDVGQGTWEEIDFQAATSSGGENYGWDCREGTHPYEPSEQQSPSCTPSGGYVDPIFEYSHADGCSVTGGYVYRGSAYPSLVGHYVLADYCSGNFWSLINDGQWVSTAYGHLMNNPSSFGENSQGELFVTSHTDGILYQLVGGTQINSSVTQVSVNASNNPTPQFCAATDTNLAINTITSTQQNSSANTYTDLFYRVKTLEYTTAQGGLAPSLCNATTVVDNGGVGSILAIPNSSLPGADGEFNPGDHLVQAFDVGRPVQAPFRIKVDLFTSTVDAAESDQVNEFYLGTFEYEFDTAGNPIGQHTLFLPLVVH